MNQSSQRGFRPDTNIDTFSLSKPACTKSHFLFSLLYSNSSQDRTDPGFVFAHKLDQLYLGDLTPCCLKNSPVTHGIIN